MSNNTSIHPTIRSRLHPLFPHIYYTKKRTIYNPDNGGLVTYIGTILQYSNEDYTDHPIINDKEYYLCLINPSNYVDYEHIPYKHKDQIRRRYTSPERVSPDSSWNLDTFYDRWKQVEDRWILRDSNNFGLDRPSITI